MQVRSKHVSASRIALALASFTCAVSLIAGCGNSATINQSYFAEISASSNTIRVNQQLQISTHVQVTGSPLTFYVNGVQGGNTELGTVDNNGLYKAPAIVPVPNTVTITSIATKYPDYPKGSLTLSVLNPIPVLTSISPSSLTEGTTTVTATGSQFVFGAQIVWNGTPVQTTYVSSTQLVAAITAPNPGTFPLLVRNPDPGSADSAALNVQVGPGQVAIAFQTYAGTTVRVRNSLSIVPKVTGTSNTGLTLKVNGVAGGNAQVGTAVVDKDGNIVYTAPAVVPTPSNVVQLAATSTDNPTVSAVQNISVLNPIPILSSATPMSLGIAPPATTVTLTGQDFITGAKVLVNGSAVATTFNSGTQLTASVSPTESGNLDLQVLNPNPGPATSTDLILTAGSGPPTLVVPLTDASRFLQHATFGATDADIHHLSLTGYQAWLNEQFAMTPTPQAPVVEQALILNNAPCAATDVKCNATLFVQNNNSETNVQDTFWQQSLAASDQLRQRVQYTLTQMFVISDNDAGVENMPRGEANYYDLLGKDAFGNFRTLLEDVTLNPMMGQYLSMLGNDKGNATTDPDENYAREVMQLFTIGLYQLNDDGSQKLDSSGKPIPTYSNVDVQGLAKVFTGFSWSVPGNTTSAWSNCCMYVGPGIGEDLLPMQSYPDHHSTAEKDFLGVTIPAQSNPDPTGDLKIALDTLFNHPNLPAFFSKQMIGHLVTSNPSPAYISRVAAVFKDNGSGVRGDMKAVITAILTDPEALQPASSFSNPPQYGKVREALIRYTEWARAFTAQSRNGSYNIGSTEDPIYGLGEMWLRSPTVFNWFAPGYVPPGTSIEKAGLIAPEMQMTNVTTVVGYLNYIQNQIGASTNQGVDIFSSYATEMNLAANPTDLVDRINLLLMAGEMDSTLYSQIVSAVGSIPIPTGDPTAINAALANRVKAAIYLTMASPSFCAQY